MNEGGEGGEDARLGQRRNLARYFAENRHVGWVLLAATLVLGVLAYAHMPKRKDPFIKIRAAVAVCAWPGATPEKVEELVTRKIEERAAQNADVLRVESTSRTGVSVVTIFLREDVPAESLAKSFDDVDLRLRSIHDLPPGASPIEVQKDFGDTAALMLTVASPKARPTEIAVRARAIAEGLRAERRAHVGSRVAVVLGLPLAQGAEPFRRAVRAFEKFAVGSGRVGDLELVEGPGFFALDALVDAPDAWTSLVDTFLAEQIGAEFHADLWKPIVVGERDVVEELLSASAGDAFTYRDLDAHTEQIARRLRGLPAVARVTRVGVVDERIYLDYAQERFAALGLPPSALGAAISGRNVAPAGGFVDAHGRTLAIGTSGEYASAADIGDTLLTATGSGGTVHVRDVVDVTRDYESPPSYVNYLSVRDKAGKWGRLRAITIAVQMRAGEQMARFSEQVDEALADVERTLPEDLVVVRTSDQARQVDEKVGLFLTSLAEAMVIIVVMGLVGFREWRSALVLALSIPLTLAMTFAFMAALGVDIQQISLAALILALGLLVDDPVVAGDAIRHELDQGRPRVIAAWIGPTRLARAILFATITNIVAYLPFLLFSGDVGIFIHSLPIVLTCSLVASRIVSMTFIPLLGYAILRPRAPDSPSSKGRAIAAYRRLVAGAIAHRYRVAGASLVVLALGGVAAASLKSSFFPKDYSHVLYADVLLPEGATLRATNDVAAEAAKVVQDVAAEYGERRGRGARVLESIASFVGGGAPRFWYSLSPQPRQPNYAQLVIDVGDERDTAKLVAPLQAALTSRVPGARIDVRQLENGKPVAMPVEIRFSGDDREELHVLGDGAKRILRGVDFAERVRDDAGEGGFRVSLDVDTERAGLAGVSNADVAGAAAAGFGGAAVGSLRDGERSIPIVARLRHDERGKATDLGDLYVGSSHGAPVPIGQVAQVSYRYGAQKLPRRNQRPTLTVSCFPAGERLPSEIMSAARAPLLALRAKLPPGFTMEIGGSEENVVQVTRESVVIAAVSLAAILIALVIQLRHALKPLLVLAAIPHGVCGAAVALAVTGSPFGFTAILGVISLIGVIVSHVIVLFDAIEESRERGVALEQALLDASTQRLRPVLVTVGATVFGLVPLALHGGPLWEPLCYAQIGGLTLATAITLLLVPILYAVVVLDLKWIAWAPPPRPEVAPRGVLRLVPDPAPPRGLVLVAGGKRAAGSSKRI